MTNTAKRPFRFWSFFFSTQDRVSRVPYALFVPLTYGLLLAVAFIVPRILIYFGDYQTGGMVNVIIGFCLLVLLWPHFAVTRKRLQDAGLPMWFALLIFTPIIGAFTLIFWYMGRMPNPLATPTRLDTFIQQYARLTIDGLKFFNLAAMCALALIPGTKGANRYGPNPLNPDQAVSDVF